MLRYDCSSHNYEWYIRTWYAVNLVHFITTHFVTLDLNYHTCIHSDSWSRSCYGIFLPCASKCLSYYELLAALVIISYNKRR